MDISFVFSLMIRCHGYHVKCRVSDVRNWDQGKAEMGWEEWDKKLLGNVINE